MNTRGDDLSSRYKNIKVRVTFFGNCPSDASRMLENPADSRKSTEALLKIFEKFLHYWPPLTQVAHGSHMDWKMGKHFPVKEK